MDNPVDTLLNSSPHQTVPLPNGRGSDGCGGELRRVPISKSQRKREAESLQKMGVALIALSLVKLDALPLSEPLRKAIIDAKSIKSHGAKRRQNQLIGKLMRASDVAAIQAAYQQLII